MDQRYRLCASLAVVVAVATASHVLAAETGAIGQAPVDRMIDLNRRAFMNLQQQHFQAAKYWLAEALVIAETAGLEQDEMTARTYVHLAVVSSTGMQNREEAIHNFRLALRINPNITITSGLETPALKSAYLQAREELELPPSPDPTLEVTPATPPTPEISPPLPRSLLVDDQLDPDLPARVAMPVQCAVPVEVPAQRELLVRCLTHKHQRRANATLFYRQDDPAAKYLALPMGHSPKGWLVATIPAEHVTGRSLTFYVKAQLPGSSTSIYYGYPEAPKTVAVTAPASSAAVPGSAPGPDASRPDRGHNRRGAGATWLSLGTGLGAVYHGREPVDSGTRAIGTTETVQVERGFSAAKLFSLEPELGHQLTPRLSVSLLLRYQYAPLRGSIDQQAGERAVPSHALAAFARAHLLLGSLGNLQGYLSGGAGGGRSFLAVIDRRCAQNQCTLDHSDTLHGGPVGLTAGLGVVYRLSPRFGVLLDVKEIVTLPNVMALTEVNLGVEVVHDFHGRATGHARRRTGTASWQ